MFSFEASSDYIWCWWFDIELVTIYFQFFILWMCVITCVHVTCVFDTHYSDAYPMGAVLREVNQDKINDDTSLNTWKSSLSLKEAGNPDALIIVESDDYGIELNNYIVTEMEDYDGGIVEPYSPSGMWG